MAAQQHVVVYLNILPLQTGSKNRNELTATCDVTRETIILPAHQKVQIIIHIVEQAADHRGQMDHFVWSVFVEESSRRCQITSTKENIRPN